MEGLCKHLKPEDFAQFIEQGREGCSWWPLEHHLTQCAECMQKLDAILRAGIPQMAEREPLSS